MAPITRPKKKKEKQSSVNQSVSIRGPKRSVLHTILRWSRKGGKISRVNILRDMINILKTNVPACKGIGMPFASHLALIYEALHSFYRIYSQDVSEAVREHGEDVFSNPIVRQMRNVKRKFLVLLSPWVAKADDDDEKISPDVPRILDAVFNCTLEMINKEKISPFLPRILNAVFNCTRQKMNEDMEAFLAHRSGIFRLLLSLWQASFPVFLTLLRGRRSLVDAVMWVFQHSMRNVAKMGLGILKDLLTKVTILFVEQTQFFYKKYSSLAELRHYLELLLPILAFVADPNQVQIAGMTYFAEIMFRALESSITVPLNASNPSQQKIDFISDHIGKIFTNVTTDQVRVIIKGFVSFNNNIVAMKNHIRDFLVQLKNKKLMIPGMAKPNDQGCNALNRLWCLIFRPTR